MDKLTVQDALDYCLDNPEGLSAEKLLERFPEYRDELQPLLALSASLAQVASDAPPPVPLARRAAMKSRLQAVPRERAASAPTLPNAQVGEPQLTAVRPPVPARPSQAQAAQRRPWWRPMFSRPALAAASMAVIAVAFLWWSAARALPDSPFYNVKIASESFMLNFAGGDADRARAHLNLAGARLGDISAMRDRGRLASAGPAIDSYGSNINSCSTFLDRTGDARADIQARLGASMKDCDSMFRSFGADLRDLPEDSQDKVAGLYRSMGMISARIGAPPLQSPDPFSPDSTPTAAQAAATSTVIAAATRTAAIVSPTAALATETARTVAATATPRRPAATTRPTQPPVPPATARRSPTVVPNTPVARPSNTSTATEPPKPQPTATTPPTTPTDIPAPPPPRSPPPTDTAVPTFTPAAPIPPGLTRVPPLPTPRPSLASTDTPPAQQTCNLLISAVEVECDNDEVEWEVEIENGANRDIAAKWSAELQVLGQTGGWQREDAASGSIDVSPGGAPHSDAFDYGAPPEIRSIRVRVTLTETLNTNCRTSRFSGIIDPCED